MSNPLIDSLVASCKQLDLAKSSPYTPGSIGPPAGQGEQCAHGVCAHSDALFKRTSFAAAYDGQDSAIPSASKEIWSAGEVPSQAEGGCDDPRPMPE